MAWYFCAHYHDRLHGMPGDRRGVELLERPASQAPSAWSVTEFGPATWPHAFKDSTMTNSPASFYTETRNGPGDALVKLRLTRFRDGDIVSLAISHAVAGEPRGG